MLRRIHFGIGFSWVMSVTLRPVFVVSGFGREALALPAVLPVAVEISSLNSLLFSPLAVRAAKTGPRNLFTYAPALWAVLAAHIVAGARPGSLSLQPASLPWALLGLWR